jgi:transcription antitermination factor NusG
LRDIAELRWYAVLTKSQKESQVDVLLRKLGLTTLFLHFNDVTRHARREREVTRALFPRYVFAGASDGFWVPEINRTIGVSTVVLRGDQPLEVPVAVIEELRQRGDKKGLVAMAPEATKEHRRRFRQGEQVRIIDGPLAGLFAIVGLDSGPAVRVWLEMFGGKVEALLAPEGLESVSPVGGLVEIPRRQSHR